MMTGLSKRERCIFGVCAVVILLYAGKAIIRHPSHSGGGSRENKIFEEERALRRSFQKLRHNKGIEAEYRLYIEEFQQGTSDEEEMSFLISTIHAYAKKYALNISDFKPGRIKSGDFYNEFTADLALTGELPGLAQFIDILQRHPYFFNVRNLRIEKDTRSGVPLRCRITLSRTRLTQAVE